MTPHQEEQWRDLCLALDRRISNVQVELYMAEHAAVAYDRVHWFMTAVANMAAARRALQKLQRLRMVADLQTARRYLDRLPRLPR